MRADWPEANAAQTVLRVDGGMAASDWTMQRLADLLDAPVDRPVIQETTALGAAYLAGLVGGMFPEPWRFADYWRLEHSVQACDVNGDAHEKTGRLETCRRWRAGQRSRIMAPRKGRARA